MIRKYIKKRKKHIKKVSWGIFWIMWFVAFLTVSISIFTYVLVLKNGPKAPFEGKTKLEECLTLQENSMRSLCLVRLVDSELFKNGGQICETVWQWKGGGSHDMLNGCYTRATKYFRNPEFCKNLKKYAFNINSMYNPEGYEGGCLKELFTVLTDSEIANLKIENICNNLRWRYDNEKNACLAKYKS